MAVACVFPYYPKRFNMSKDQQQAPEDRQQTKKGYNEKNPGESQGAFQPDAAQTQDEPGELNKKSPKNSEEKVTPSGSKE